MNTSLKSWLVLLLLLGTTAYCVAEQITLTTYYPSPRGVYHELRTLGNIQVGSIDVPAGTAARLHVIGDGSAPAFQVDASATSPNALVVGRSGNVGIGMTPAPNIKLDVDGAINASSSGGLCIGGDCRTAWPGFSQLQVFDASGTFTVPPGVTRVMVEAWGGGGGATAWSDWSDLSIYGIHSGGGGSYAKDILSVTPGSNIAVVVGLGGAFGSNMAFVVDRLTLDVHCGFPSSFGTGISAAGGWSYNACSGATPGVARGRITVSGAGGDWGGVGGCAGGGGGCNGAVPGGGAGGWVGAESAHGRVIVWW